MITDQVRNECKLVSPDVFRALIEARYGREIRLVDYDVDSDLKVWHQPVLGSKGESKG